MKDVIINELTQFLEIDLNDLALLCDANYVAKKKGISLQELVRLAIVQYTGDFINYEDK